MTAERVEAAVEAIRSRDPILGEWVEVAADGLTVGEGEEVLSQAGVQDFLWCRLPAKYPDEAWLPVARATAALMDALGRRRYASIAASETTTALLEAWRGDAERGFARYRAAAVASGVKPPDTDLLAWGSVMGFDEVSAYGEVESRLEAAIVRGELVPGATGWKARAASCATRSCGSQRGTRPLGVGSTWQSANGSRPGSTPATRTSSGPGAPPSPIGSAAFFSHPMTSTR